MVSKITDLFQTPHNTESENGTVSGSRGYQCGDIELSGYFTNVGGPVSLVMDLRITHESFGSSSDPSLNGHLHYRNDIYRSLNESTDDKIRKVHTDYYNNPPTPISFIPTITSKSGRIHSEFVILVFFTKDEVQKNLRNF